MKTYHLLQNSSLHLNFFPIPFLLTTLFIIFHITPLKPQTLFIPVQTPTQTIRFPNLLQQSQNILIIRFLSKLQRLHILKNLLKLKRSSFKQHTSTSLILFYTNFGPRIPCMNRNSR